MALRVIDIEFLDRASNKATLLHLAVYENESRMLFLLRVTKDYGRIRIYKVTRSDDAGAVLIIEEHCL